MWTTPSPEATKPHGHTRRDSHGLLRSEHLRKSVKAAAGADTGHRQVNGLCFLGILSHGRYTQVDLALARALHGAMSTKAS